MKVYWTQEARDRLSDIKAYISREAPEAAIRIALDIIRRSESLSTIAARGRHVPEYPETDLRELLERPYRIIYRVTPTQVEIITVKHYRQRLPKQPRY